MKNSYYYHWNYWAGKEKKTNGRFNFSQFQYTPLIPDVLSDPKSIRILLIHPEPRKIFLPGFESEFFSGVGKKN